MKTRFDTYFDTWRQCALVAVLLGLVPGSAGAFDSGSSGDDGAFSPAVNTEVQVPPDGVFNHTTVNVPTGVTVTYKRNATNTPVTILASGNVTIAGTINVSGGVSPDVGAAGNGNLGDDGQPGLGGPGGFDGGRGGLLGANSGTNRRGGNGLGPGAGGGATRRDTLGCGGGGGGFGAAGAAGIAACSGTQLGAGGSSYGVAGLLPLIGGSGGGGGSAGDNFQGSGGGGGGGAILIASSLTVNVTGSIRANGGNSGGASGTANGGTGGGGSGGAIRIIATTLSGNGAISAPGGSAGSEVNGSRNGGAGAVGRIRLEAENMLRTASTNPVFSFAGPQPVFVAGMPGLRITRVAGVDAPAAPTGSADIVLPETTPNPVTVEFATTNVPVGNTVSLTVTPANAAPVTTLS
ncbi:MAG: hypothetical protein ACREMG_01605, partial [Gemmatimonadales bacterium]